MKKTKRQTTFGKCKDFEYYKTRFTNNAANYLKDER